ncbi:hypothetical protein BCR34DRAFT_592826 [Clohesyomyces aquaticus]|uniref:Uncharacterized protein n=1 Tax=Clohesyomyces aquaticus TaxID=1231657 RepID=A0A1Y1YNW0_9PLEO|nr:hypothetical protein BCR34DRAFT_592826 [Clohesyomyces aquaticus]
MANLANPRIAAADFGGKHMQDHKLVFESQAGIRNSDQRSPSGDDAPQGSTNHSGGRGSGQATGEQAANEDDDEDSSANQEDEQEDEDDDPDVLAPSRGIGLGKGKRPVIRIDHAAEDELPDDDEDYTSRATGHKTSKHPVNHPLMSNKKRTFSNVSNTSLLFGEDDDEKPTFPRTKIARKLSSAHDGKREFLTYAKKVDTNGRNRLDNAIESSDEEQVDPTINIDDEDYSGVNLISDESDLENLEEQEETYIISQEKQHATDLFGGPLRGSPAGDDFLSSVVGFQAPEYPDIGFGQFFKTQVPLPASPEPSPQRKYSDGSHKRVRFEDEVDLSDSSSSSTSELDSGLWPDLFVEQDRLPPSLYKLIENDQDSDLGDFPSSGSDHSYWDVGQDERVNPALQDLADEDLDGSSDAGSLSGYETDLGDTTDEYDSDFMSEHQNQLGRQKSVLHRPSSAPGSMAASPKPFERSHNAATPRRAIPPLRGIFIHDDGEAIAVTNRTTKKVTFYRPRVSAPIRQPNFGASFGIYSSTSSAAENSPRASLLQLNAEDSDFSNEFFSNPFQGSTDIMLTGIFGADPGSSFGNGFLDTIGPPEAFYPFVSVGQNGTIIDDDEDDYFDDDDIDDDDLDIADFMDFGPDADATDIEDEGETDVPQTPATSMIAMNGSTPAQPTPLTQTPTRRPNTSEAMLEHFDRGVVTAFRNNQNRYRDLSCLPNDPDLRASESRPLRSGRSAETLISPLRKRSSISKKTGSSSLSRVTKATGKLQSSVMEPRRGPRLGTFS